MVFDLKTLFVKPFHDSFPKAFSKGGASLVGADARAAAEVLGAAVTIADSHRGNKAFRV